MSYRSSRGDSIAPALAIIILCFVVYIAAILPSFLDSLNYDLVKLFGLQPATFIQAPWTIVTSLFVHGSIWHHFIQYDDPLLLRHFLDQTCWDSCLPPHILFGRNSWQYLLYAFRLRWFSNIAFLYSYRCLGRYICPGWCAGRADAQIARVCLSHTGSHALWVAVIGGFVIMSFLSEA